MERQPIPSPDRQDTVQTFILTRAVDIARQHNGPDAVADDFALLYGLSHEEHLRSILGERRVDLTDFRLNVQDYMIMRRAAVGIDDGNVTESVAATLEHAIRLAREQNEAITGKHVLDAFFHNGNKEAVDLLKRFLRD